VLHLAGLLMGGVVVHVQIIREEALQDVMLLAYLASIVQTGLRERHALVLLVRHVSFLGQDLHHLAHACR
jgi:hypothetical protein